MLKPLPNSSARSTKPQPKQDRPELRKLLETIIRLAPQAARMNQQRRRPN
jgi:hypothetical protein